ncbi:phage baseplate assembly protein V [Sorangium sp. So ce861]|uniref:phage baseplate assembly protein V n=1 Tax=Sorangium sp. So ce861 TaxID=3133323 RepID=UPI003F5E4ECC
MIGVVIDRDPKDPQYRGCVKVRYPTHADMETSWARVMVPYGGAGHGFKAIPEVGDEVVVGFELGNSMRPIVLGSVYSQKNPPPLPQDIDIRVLQSPGGHRITLADRPPGGKITLESGDVRLGGANALHPAILGDVLDRFLTQLITWLRTHIHVAPAGPPMPPFQTALQLLQSPLQLRAHLSRIVKIER